MKDFMESVNYFIDHYEETNEYYPDKLREIDTLFGKYTKQPLEDAYLAHYKHAIEHLSYIRNGEVTRINYDFLRDENKLPSGCLAKVQYFDGGYNITIPGKLSSRAKRILIGHELGHILISLLQNIKPYNKSEIYKSSNHYPEGREILANIFCYIMHIHQSEHYCSDSFKDYIYCDSNIEEQGKKRNQLFHEIRELTKATRKGDNTKPLIIPAENKL